MCDGPGSCGVWLSLFRRGLTQVPKTEEQAEARAERGADADAERDVAKDKSDDEPDERAERDQDQSVTPARAASLRHRRSGRPDGPRRGPS